MSQRSRSQRDVPAWVAVRKRGVRRCSFATFEQCDSSSIRGGVRSARQGGDAVVRRHVHNVRLGSTGLHGDVSGRPRADKCRCSDGQLEAARLQAAACTEGVPDGGE
jgi:hypothetical protein